MKNTISQPHDLYIWDPVVRLCHWGIVLAFFVNYFIVEPGRLIHEVTGYTASALVCIRIGWGMIKDRQSLASFKHIDLSRNAFAVHIRQLTQGKVAKTHGHNPFGWLMVMAVCGLLLGLGITGFMMEEVDIFFGNSTLENIHAIFANTLYGCVLVHIAAVFVVQHKGKIELIRPMLSGKRKGD
ncbi:cytochrome b/b6 domain-containing protein [Alteromonas sp. D210916BOD_24]|uniref:cytochrome b/b6 domain-containing protein n=1 Tax=Alteromonas sp. D210916BOD_24 TaxID=3157618 RepID=UPI00399C89C9